jgi:hypothetical protein
LTVPRDAWALGARSSSAWTSSRVCARIPWRWLSNLLPDASDAFYWAMWREGLATLVSRQLNPTLPEEQVCCLPPIEPVRAALPKLIPEAISLLDSTRREDYARYFLGGTPLDVPSRSGYYLGYHVAREIGQGRRLAELARLTPASIRPRLEEALRRLN